MGKKKDENKEGKKETVWENHKGKDERDHPSK